MRVSLVLLLSVAVGCRVEAHKQTEYDDTDQPAVVGSQPWNGEPISIVNDGVSSLVGTGGIVVNVDQNATAISAVATFSAQADPDKSDDARASIADAVQTLTVMLDNGSWNVACHHGNAHGTSGVATSGCKLLTVTIPPGSVAKPLNITVGNTNGAIVFGLPDPSNTQAVVNEMTIDNNGLGDTRARAIPVPGARIAVTGERAVEMQLPQSFSTESITFTFDDPSTDPATIPERIIASSFPGIADGKPYPTSGATADAAQQIALLTHGPFDEDTITVSGF